MILTAGCAKYKYNKLDLGDTGGIPRVLDAGQCNDSYSLAVIALKLKEVFGLEDVNQLPIVYNIAWYEQKAVIVLLALLSLGVKNIHLGPTLRPSSAPTWPRCWWRTSASPAPAPWRRTWPCSSAREPEDAPARGSRNRPQHSGPVPTGDRAFFAPPRSGKEPAPMEARAGARPCSEGAHWFSTVPMNSLI